jgi:hypothetical protein
MPTLTLRRTTSDPACPPLERALLRRSVGDQEAHRHRCVHCHRTPLTGELVHVYAGAAGHRLVCDLCRPLRRAAPIRSELMHAPDHERAVRVTRRAA